MIPVEIDFLFICYVLCPQLIIRTQDILIRIAAAAATAAGAVLTH